ncbi:hypothetical protein ACLQ3K_24915 [Tsukamurella sp. DT100]|uniref:hypothetical protein n=1 Tax=Tsukamurella sp. DT100 TaxID=3393415 RepID=UPI003CF7E3C8
MAKLLRPLVPGDVVITYCAWLAGWTGAQVLRDSYGGKTVEIVDLDWVSPTQPRAVADLGEISPLVNPQGRCELPRFAQINVPRLLPTSYRVLGNTPPLELPPGNVLGDWTVGFLLDEAQRHAAGAPPCPWLVDCNQSELGTALAGRPDGEVFALFLHRIEELDCADLVSRFPQLVHLFLSGTPDHPFRPYTGADSGRLTNADALNDLRDLETLNCIASTA